MSRPLSEILCCLVCGFKQGGTTFVLNVVASHPGNVSRFEIGLLLPGLTLDLDASMRPKHLKQLIRDWRLTTDDLDTIRSLEDKSELYQFLIEKMSALESPPSANVRLVDKFPDYSRHLDYLIDTFSIPTIFVSRDPRAVYYSRLKRVMKSQGLSSTAEAIKAYPPQKFAREYVLIHSLCESARSKHDELLHCIKFEDLLLNFEAGRRGIFRFLGLEAPSGELPDSRSIGVKPDKLRPGIELSSMQAFEDQLPAETQARLLELCSDAESFFSS